MAKKTDSRFILTMKILWEGICIYLKYLPAFFKYMLFPVFGQLVGLALIFTVNYFFVINLPILIKSYPIFDNILFVFTILLICVFPGFLIFCKAFFDYMIAYPALNSMVYVSRGEKMKNHPLDTKTHTDIVKKRLGKYIVLLLLISILGLIGCIPLISIPIGILAVYFCLAFQVFMLEESVTPLGALKRSFYLVKGNFAMTSLLLVFSGLITYWLLPQLTVFVCEKINITNVLSYPVQKYIDILPIKEAYDNIIFSILNSLPLSASDFNDLKTNFIFDSYAWAKDIVSVIVAGVATCMLLPLRCAWFTLIYKQFDIEKTEELRKIHIKKN